MVTCRPLCRVGWVEAVTWPPGSVVCGALVVGFNLGRWCAVVASLPRDLLNASSSIFNHEFFCLLLRRLPVWAGSDDGLMGFGVVVTARVVCAVLGYHGTMAAGVLC